MVIDLTREQEANIAQIAEQNGKSPSEVLAETAQWLYGVADDEQEQRIIDERIAEADAGVAWIEEAEMDERVRKMLMR